ncbi:MAG: DinB family protein [Rhodanobacter sp.]
MKRVDHIRLMATYNEWMNAKVYAAARHLSDEELVANRRAFFGSILETLNHLVTSDTLWLKRFATHPAAYTALESVRNLPVPDVHDLLRFPDLHSLTEHRKWLDGVIIEWAGTVAESDLDFVLHYANSQGTVGDKNFFGLLMHFFNHQTHHRGQVTTLLSQQGIDVGVTDLNALVPNFSGA